MTPYTPTDAQLEWAARLLCVAQGVNADALSEWPDFHFVWEHETPQARRLLAEFERQEVKVTKAFPVPIPDDNWGDWTPDAKDVWFKAHDAAPLCPESDQ